MLFCSSGEEHAHLMIIIVGPFSIFGTFLMRHVRLHSW